MKKIRIAWGITGAGDYLTESMSVMKNISGHSDVEVTVLVSKNAEMVMKLYKLWRDLISNFEKIKVEKGPNKPFVVGSLQVGYYSLFYVSPATANTTAKIAHGIADTLITNCVSQAVKGGTPVYIYPVDQKVGCVETQIPGGDSIKIRTRRVDVENVEKLKGMEGISVLKHPSDIEPIIASVFAGKSCDG